MKSLAAFEHCFIGNKTEPDGKGFYKCIDVKEIRAAGIDNLFIVGFCYHREI